MVICYRYAFLEFDNEVTAEKNLKKLKTKKLDNELITVDYCGGKATTSQKRGTIARTFI